MSGNAVVLKRLESDCLHRGQLHPSIRDRLRHVRELPRTRRLETLRTVERWEGIPYLVWNYVEGETWEDAVSKANGRLPQLISELAATVDALHENGIVHGALQGQNIFVKTNAEVWLTHVSPYLYADRQVDILAVVCLAKTAIEKCPEFGGLAKQVERLESGQHTLHEFSNEVLNPHAVADLPAIENQHRYSISSVVMAAIVTAVAAAIWIAIRSIEFKPSVRNPTTFRSLR